MSARNGSLVTIKIGSDTQPEIFTSLGGLERVQVNISQPYTDRASPAFVNWRHNSDSSGLLYVRVNATGIDINQRSNRLLRQTILNKASKIFQIIFEKGDKLTGRFVIVEYQQLESSSNQDRFSIELLSSGAITYSNL
jgi:predicted secreted protein